MSMMNRIWLVAVTVLALLGAAPAQLNVLTHRYDAARDGQNLNETLLNSTNVNQTQFGNIFTFNVDGWVAAQPLYMQGLNIGGVGTRDVLFVATMHDSVYALDADNLNGSAPLWQTSFLNPSAGVTSVPIADQGCPLVTLFTEVGVLGTPVIDANTGTMYVVAKTKEVVGSVTNYVFRLHALDITTGLEKFGGPVVINPTFVGPNGTVTLNNQLDMQRPALLLSNGTVYVSFGSNGCDRNAHGWVVAMDAGSLQQLAVFNTTPAQSWGGSTWMSGEGPAADSSGNVYFSTANGVFDASTGGVDYGDSVVKLNLLGSSLTVADYFTPFDQSNMNTNDLDLGSGAVILLPDQPGVFPHLAVAIGKTGTIYLLNRDSLGGYNPSGDTQIVQSIPTATLEVYGSATYWNNKLYFSARNDFVKQYTMTNGQISATPTASSTGAYLVFGVPSLSANGNSNGLLWQVRNLSTRGAMVLSAYDANSMAELYNTNQNSTRDALGSIPHFQSPLVANGRVYVGTQGFVKVYGLLPSLTVFAGNRQTGTVATALPKDLTIHVINPYTGFGIAGVSVTFSDGGKGGSFSNTTVVSDSTGSASTTYTLPQTAGTYTITATSAGYVTGSFTEIATAGTPTAILLSSGGFQSATVNTNLPNAVVVKVRDAFGNGVPNQPVTFVDNGAGGTFAGNPVTTSTNGIATENYKVGTKAGSITLTATTGTATPLNIQEKATPGAVASLTMNGGNLQSGTAGTQLPKPLNVVVKDQFGNLIAGATVTFSDGSAGGSLSTMAPITGSNGVASVMYTLPGTPQTVSITATINSFVVTFTETAK
jgi:hypothetical protein